MELTGNGLNNGSHMYFYTPSQTAKKMMYYPIAAGEFYCNGDYSVVRTSYDSILAIYVSEGSITLVQDGAELKADRGELLLADCYKPHKYFTSTSAHTLWVHFDGCQSRTWFEEIRLQKGQKINCGKDIADSIKSIIGYIKSNKSEYDISSELYSMLCRLSKSDELSAKSDKSDRLKTVIEYININYDKAVTVDEMAGLAYMSASYFSKAFKENTSFSPYDYLLGVRLGKAKELLLKTKLSVSDIAYKTGFNSTSNFIYFFKKETGISPLKFRNISF